MSTLAEAPSTAPENDTKPTKAPVSRPHRTVLDWVFLVLAIVGALIVIFPLLLILLNSFKSPDDYNNGGPLHLPSHLYFGGISRFWHGVNFPQKLWNSIFISGMVAILGVIVSLFNAYASASAASAAGCRCWWSSCSPTCCPRRPCSTRSTTSSRASGCTTASGR